MTAHFIAAKKLRPENAKNCLNYFATYATVSNGQTMSLLKSVFRDIYSKATMWIGEMLNSANLKKSELNDLKLRANNCVQSECNDVSAKISRSNFCQSFFEAKSLIWFFFSGSLKILSLFKVSAMKINYLPYILKAPSSFCCSIPRFAFCKSSRIIFFLQFSFFFRSVKPRTICTLFSAQTPAKDLNFIRT